MQHQLMVNVIKKPCMSKSSTQLYRQHLSRTTPTASNADLSDTDAA
jgi:hypothetical protein